MKHVFIINPKAGKKNNFKYISSLLNEFMDSYDIEIHQTTKELDATTFIKNYLYKRAGKDFSCFFFYIKAYICRIKKEPHI